MTEGPTRKLVLDIPIPLWAELERKSYNSASTPRKWAYAILADALEPRPLAPRTPGVFVAAFSKAILGPVDGIYDPDFIRVASREATEAELWEAGKQFRKIWGSDYDARKWTWLLKQELGRLPSAAG